MPSKLQKVVGLQVDLIDALLREANARFAIAVLPEDFDTIARILQRAELAARTAALELIEHDRTEDTDG